MTLIYIAKLSFIIKIINIHAKKIDNLFLKIYKIAITMFLL